MSAMIAAGIEACARLEQTLYRTSLILRSWWEHNLLNFHQYWYSRNIPVEGCETAMKH